MGVLAVDLAALDLAIILAADLVAALLFDGPHLAGNILLPLQQLLVPRLVPPGVPLHLLPLQQQNYLLAKTNLLPLPLEANLGPTTQTTPLKSLILPGQQLDLFPLQFPKPTLAA